MEPHARLCRTSGKWQTGSPSELQNVCRKFCGKLAEIAKSSQLVKRIEHVWTALLTLGHEREHELDVCDVGAPGLRAADRLALDRVRARHLTHRGMKQVVYNLWLC